MFVLLVGWVVADTEARLHRLGQLLDRVASDDELLRLAALAHQSAADSAAAARSSQGGAQVCDGNVPCARLGGGEAIGFSSSLQSSSSLMIFDTDGESPKRCSGPRGLLQKPYCRAPGQCACTNRPAVTGQRAMVCRA